MQIAQTMDASSDLRVLTDDELDDVNGGFFFVGWVLGFAAGAAVGYVVARYLS